MKEEYDFSNSRKNPYAKRLKKQITIKIDEDVLDYFKLQSEDSGIPYQRGCKKFCVFGSPCFPG